MHPPRPELRRGRIVWVSVRDRKGVEKRRPAIVVTPTHQIAENALIHVMPITTTYPAPPPSEVIELPWHPQGKVSTRLRRRSAAVVNWLAEVSVDDILELEGDVPTTLMLEILKRLDRKST